MYDLAIAVLVAALLAVSFVRLAALRALASFAIDTPNARSLHAEPTPRTGGLGLFAALGVTWLVLGQGALLPILLLSGLLLVTSLVDDARSLPVGARFAMHAGAAVALLTYAGAPLVWLPVLAVGIVWCTNLYNFMDGSDGLAGSMAGFGFGGYAIHAHAAGAGDLALVSAIVAGAALGFLVWNWPPARIFLGDAGSVPLGFLAGSVGVLGWLRDVWPPTLPLLLFAPFAVDATLTLLRRLLRGENVFTAHRSHLYQKIVLAGWTKRQLLVVSLALMASLGVASILLRSASGWTEIFVSSVVIMTLAAAHTWLDRLVSDHSTAAPT